MAAYEIGCPYWIYAPDGVNKIVFNLASDPDYCGLLSDITGLDDADVRESADVVASGRGGRPHKNYVGRRPWTMTGVVIPITPASARAASMDKIEGLMHQCLQKDGQLQWLPSDGILRFANFRKQLSVRMTKGQGQVDRRFTITGVIDNAEILSGAGYDTTSTGTAPSISAVNAGTAVAAPRFLVGGPVTNPVITNTATGDVFRIAMVVAAGVALDIDLTARYPTVAQYGVAGTSYNGNVDLALSSWDIGVSPQRYTGANVFTLTGAGMTGASYLRMLWHDSWA